MPNALLIVVYFGILLALTKPLGLYLARLFSGARVFLSPVLRPVEQGIYTLAGVDERLEGYMREHAIDAVWPTAERVLVLVDDRLATGAVLRHAWRLASALRGELVAMAVVPPGGLATLPIDARTGLGRNLRLAEDLGATTRLLEQKPDGSAEDPALRLAQVARDENATVLVLGHAPEGFWKRLRGPSLVDRLLRLVDNVGIHLVELRESGDGQATT